MREWRIVRVTAIEVLFWSPFTFFDTPLKFNKKEI